MEDNKRQLTPADFEFVQRDDKIHDKAFDTKPTTFLKDAVKRFCKNKSSIVAFGIIGLLVLMSIFLPIISRKNIDYVSSPEAFLAPKLFKTGTGFWDGTRKVEDVVYDTVNEVPGGYYANGVLDLKILGDEYIDNTNDYGMGGYAAFINETTDIAYAHSFETLMTSTGNYKVEVNMHDAKNYAEGELAQYAVYLKVYEDLYEYQEGDVKPTETLLLLKDFSNDKDCSIALRYTNNIERYGFVNISDDYKITSFVEKGNLPENRIDGYINGGIYYLKKTKFYMKKIN